MHHIPKIIQIIPVPTSVQIVALVKDEALGLVRYPVYFYGLQDNGDAEPLEIDPDSGTLLHFSDGTKFEVNYPVR